MINYTPYFVFVTSFLDPLAQTWTAVAFLHCLGMILNVWMSDFCDLQGRLTSDLSLNKSVAVVPEAWNFHEPVSGPKTNRVQSRQQSLYNTIFTFSKQAFNESLDFCNHSYPHESHKI